MAVIKNRTSISQGNKYYDDLAKAGYTEARDYQQVLFKPGKVLQSRELNFLQSLLHEKIKNRNDLEFKNGSVIMGCDLSLNVADLANAVATVGDGVVYWDGSFIKFFSDDSEATDISLATTVSIYLVPVYETVDYTTDTNLYDPAIVYKINKSVTGGDRLKLTFTIHISDDPEDFEDTNRQCFKIGTYVIASGETILNNRDPFLFEQDPIGETKVVQGLRVRPNPMREVYSINDGTDGDVDNNFAYNDTVKKAFIEVEEGTALINDKQVINAFSRVFTFDKALSETEDNVITTQELKEADFKDIDVSGIYGDIMYGTKYIDRKTFMFDMLQPGKAVKIMMRVPLQRSLKADPTTVSTQMRNFEVCSASIADVFDLWKISFQKQAPELIGIDKLFDTSMLNELSTIDLSGTRLLDSSSSTVDNGTSNIGSIDVTNDSNLLFKKSGAKNYIGAAITNTAEVIQPDPSTNAFTAQLISAFSAADEDGYINWITVIGGVYGYDGTVNSRKLSNIEGGLSLVVDDWSTVTAGGNSERVKQFAGRSDLGESGFGPLSNRFFTDKSFLGNILIRNFKFSFSVQGTQYYAIGANPLLYKYNDEYYSGSFSTRYDSLKNKTVNVAPTVITLLDQNGTGASAVIDSNVTYSGFCRTSGIKIFGNMWLKDNDKLYDGTYYSKIVDTLNGITSDSGSDAWKDYVLIHERIKITF